MNKSIVFGGIFLVILVALGVFFVTRDNSKNDLISERDRLQNELAVAKKKLVKDLIVEEKGLLKNMDMKNLEKIFE